MAYVGAKGIDASSGDAAVTPVASLRLASSDQAAALPFEPGGSAAEPEPGIAPVSEVGAASEIASESASAAAGDHASLAAEAPQRFERALNFIANSDFKAATTLLDPAHLSPNTDIGLQIAGTSATVQPCEHFSQRIKYRKNFSYAGRVQRGGLSNPTGYESTDD